MSLSLLWRKNNKPGARNNTSRAPIVVVVVVVVVKTLRRKKETNWGLRRHISSPDCRRRGAGSHVWSCQDGGGDGVGVGVSDLHRCHISLKANKI